MQKLSLISIVIVAGLDRKKELLYCLKTVYKSTYKNFEVLLIDNSTDPSLIPDVMKAYNETRCFRMPQNTGIFAYNVGFANAKGEYILIIDDDCSILPETLENIEKSFKKKQKNVGVLVTNVFNPLTKIWSTDFFNKRNSVEISSFAGATVFRREVLEKVGYFDADFFCWFHETDLCLRVLDHGYKVHYEKNIIVYHHQKVIPFRPNMLYYIYRNIVLFNIKHFSPGYLILLTLRDIVSVIFAPIKHRNINVLPYVVMGYLNGWANVYAAFKKRSPVKKHIQRTFIEAYVFGKL
jgi:hypothetical protein